VPLRTHLVASGRFIGAMPKLLASQSLVKILPVEVPVRPLRFAIFTLKGRTLSPAVARFIAHLRDFARPT
jgi:DNA-binding transcriptional LysR family regulator